MDTDTLNSADFDFDNLLKLAKGYSGDEEQDGSDSSDSKPSPLTVLSGPGSDTDSMTKISIPKLQYQFFQNGNDFMIRPLLPEPTPLMKLPIGFYVVNFHPKMGFYLTRASSFERPAKLYGEVVAKANRFLDTLQRRAGNTGVLLAGNKGSGKTLLARETCLQAIARDIPVLIISMPASGQGFSDFLESIQQEVVVFIDEFEKVYSDKEKHQPPLLTLLDGVFTTRKLFVLTCNNLANVNEFFINRPGRIHYLLRFEGLDPKFVQEYVQDNLQDKTLVQKAINLTLMVPSLNFDVLKALVWEINTYGGDPVETAEALNITFSSSQAVTKTWDLLNLPGLSREETQYLLEYCRIDIDHSKFVFGQNTPIKIKVQARQGDLSDINIDNPQLTPKLVDAVRRKTGNANITEETIDTVPFRLEFDLTPEKCEYVHSTVGNRFSVIRSSEGAEVKLTGHVYSFSESLADRYSRSFGKGA